MSEFSLPRCAVVTGDTGNSVIAYGLISVCYFHRYQADIKPIHYLSGSSLFALTLGYLLCCGPATWRVSTVSLKADQKERGAPEDVPKWPCGCSSWLLECFFMTSIVCVCLWAHPSTTCLFFRQGHATLRLELEQHARKEPL